MRKYYIDNIRSATVVSVIIYHVIYMYNGIVTEGVAGPFRELQYQDALQYLLYPWFMMILFIISGVSSRYYLEKHTIKEFIADKTRKCLVPSTIGLFVFQWIQGYFNMLLVEAFASMEELTGVVLYLIMVASGTGVLWYIQLLWLFSMMLIPIRRLEKGKLYQAAEKIDFMFLAALVIPVWLSAQVGNTPVIAVYRFGIYGCSFLLGYFVFAQEKVIERLSKYWRVLAVAAAIFGIGYVYCYFGENYAVEPVVNSPFSIVYGWTAVLAIFSCAKKWGDKSTKFSLWMEKNGFGLYVFHYLPLAAAAYGMKRYLQLPALPSYFIASMAAFFGGLILFKIISKIPILRWCVLGIKKERKSV